MRQLEKAWRHVRSNALRSAAKPTIQEAHEFDACASVRLARLQRQLRERRFVFRPARGVLLGKKGKSTKRPVVIAPIESRIVQRCLLDCLQSIPEIKAELESGYNYGGVSGPKAGVPAAIAAALKAAANHGYYIRTDIKAFFTQVPRDAAVRIALTHVEDEAFKEFFQQAVKTELLDVSKYSPEDLRLFPLSEQGVAQGSCLSPLLCNLLLADFDRQMNARGVQCIRYIDDFILFAQNRSVACAAFRSALKHLRTLGLSAYDPFSNDAEEQRKADHGETIKGFDFLGCHITPTNVRPSRKNFQSLLRNVEAMLSESMREMRRGARSPSTDWHEIPTFAQALSEAGRAIQGWGNSYQFCSDDRLMADLDREIEKRVLKFHEDFLGMVPNLKRNDLLGSALGVFALKNCKRDDSADSARSIAKLAARMSS